MTYEIGQYHLSIEAQCNHHKNVNVAKLLSPTKLNKRFEITVLPGVKLIFSLLDVFLIYKLLKAVTQRRQLKKALNLIDLKYRVGLGITLKNHKSGQKS